MPARSGWDSRDTGYGDTFQKTGFIMETAILAAFSLTGYFVDAWGEFIRYFGTMNQTQWGVVSACAVAFGFLCLKGTNVNR